MSAADHPSHPSHGNNIPNAIEIEQFEPPPILDGDNSQVYWSYAPWELWPTLIAFRDERPMPKFNRFTLPGQMTAAYIRRVRSQFN